MKVFLAGASLLPSYGGPAFSVSRLAHALADAGIEVGLWAADQSAATTTLLSAESPVRRLTGSERIALDSFGQADVIHDNGIWLPHNHRLAQLARRRGIPRVVSTRGMLEPWAMNHKRWRKALAWRLYQRRDLVGAQRLHATAEEEAANVRRLGLGPPVAVVPNGVDLPELSEVVTDAGACPDQPRTALFLGRIYPVKGLLMLVEAWAQLRPPGWILRIAGPDEAGHRGEVQAAVTSSGLSDVVSFVGPVAGEEKRTLLLSADVLVLPSYSESFGMAVAEALAHGTPVLTTTAVPWPTLAQRGCGWRVEPNVAGVAQGLRLVMSSSSQTLGEMGARGRAFMAAEFGWDGVARQFVKIYETISDKGAVHAT
ncbi:MAG: glycosyltransferase [Phenylobacterium sp.]